MPDSGKNRGTGPEPRRALATLFAGLALCVLSAFGVIHSTHDCRRLYAELQALETAQWRLQEDYGRLMLEQSTWASHHRVEKVARADLEMAPPAHGRMQVVTP
jgi:cell division protein FtsL